MSHSMTRAAAWAALALSTAGCGDEAASPVQKSSTSGSGGSPSTGGAGGAGGASTGGSGGASDEITWTPCSHFSDGAGGQVECAEIVVPADWSDPAAGEITFFVKRVLAAERPSSGQVWMLSGGPGQAGNTWEAAASAFRQLDPTLDFYLPDHRGTGRSSRLGCPEEESQASESYDIITPDEMVTCLPKLQAQWGDRLAKFSTTQAARDLGEIISRVRAPEQRVVVWGHSYGSHWGQRYLQLFPDQASGVLLSGVAVDAKLSRINSYLDGLGHEVMDRCGADAFCSSKLGPDPYATMTQLYDKLWQGHCPEAAQLGIDANTLKQLAASLLYGWNDRVIVPALVYRLDRCATQDVNALAHLAPFVTLAPLPEPIPVEYALPSALLGHHIAMSEMWDDPAPTLAQAQADFDQLNFAFGSSVDRAALFDSWPRYAADEYTGKLGRSSIPILMLHGELDFLPPAVTDPVASHFTAPGQTFVLLPRAPHSLESPTPPAGVGCSTLTLLGFFQDPNAAPATSCFPQIEPLDFEDAGGLETILLGTSDMWEGDPGAAPSPPSPDPPMVREVQRRMRARPELL